MGVVLKVGPGKAFLRRGEWRAADPDLEDELNTITQVWIEETGGPPLNAQDPEWDAAVEVARRSGGRILGHSPANRKASARIYFARRQYRFAFF